MNKESVSFYTGKFDQFKKTIPYSAIIEAFQGVVTKRIISPCSSNPRMLGKWQRDLRKALGNNGQLIVDIIPDIEQIIGKQKPVSELSSEEAASRFNETFLNFVKCIATPEHRIVLFIDDLQVRSGPR